MLRITFGPKKDEVTKGWRTLHKVELRNLPSIIRMIKLRRRKCMGHVE
jgi:hypothetical protein